MHDDIIDIDEAMLAYLRSELPGVKRIIEHEPELATLAIDVYCAMQYWIREIESEREVC